MPVRPPVHRPMGALSDAQRAAAKKAFDKKRGTAAQRGYDSKWIELRNIVRAEEPLCRQCLAEGRITATQEIDHIIPHKGNRALFIARDNLQGLCKRHHSAKTAREDGGFGNRTKKGVGG